MISSRLELLCTTDIDYETRVDLNNILDRHNVKELDNVVVDLLYYFIHEYPQMNNRFDAIEDELTAMSGRIDDMRWEMIEDAVIEAKKEMKEPLKKFERQIKNLGDTSRLVEDMDKISKEMHTTKASIKSYIKKIQEVIQELMDFMSPKKNLNIRRSDNQEGPVPQKLLVKLRRANDDINWTI